MKRILLLAMLIACGGLTLKAQPAAERHVSLSETAVALDVRSAPAVEARLLTQMLNGSDDSPVTNVKIAIKNITPNFFTYVSGWATFYDSAGMRCGEGLFKVDDIAPQESAEVDTPGLRLRCSPTAWRVVANNLMTRSVDVAKPAEAQPETAATAVSERAAPANYVIVIDGEEHPIQVNNPIVLKVGTRSHTIVLKVH